MKDDWRLALSVFIEGTVIVIATVVALALILSIVHLRHAG
jgi:hypothetical protein